MSARAEWQALRAGMTVFENADVLAVDKPPGLSVTGERGGPDIVVLAGDAAETLYPVHRIDKVTSGLVLLAKTLAAHGPLTRQFAQRTVVKGYLVLVRATGLPPSWTIDLPLSAGRKNRVRVAGRREALAFDDGRARWTLDEPAPSDKSSYPSVTVAHRLAEGNGVTALLAQPLTGRRHQIRVHLAWTGAPVLGDPLFPTTSGHDTAARTHLHSWRLRLDATWAADPAAVADLVARPEPSFWAPLPGAAPWTAAQTVWERCARGAAVP